MSKLIEGIPVSPFCQYAIDAGKSTWKFVLFIAVILVALVWFFLWNELAVLCSVVICVLAWYTRRAFELNEKMWLGINRKDHDVSTQLEEILKIFYAYSEQDIFSAGVAEHQFGSLWSPVYAQYFSGERGISADVSVFGSIGGLFAATGSLSGKVVGSVSPDSLSDLGAVIILQNELGQSVRVIIPHRQVAKQMLEKALLSFNEGDRTLRTLTSLRILRLSMYLPAKACATVTSALRVLDQIVALCGKPLDERALVKVYGQEVSPGVIMATALEIEGERGVFIPTGYFKKITDKLSEFLGSYRGDVKMLLDEQGPFAPKETQSAS